MATAAELYSVMLAASTSPRYDFFYKAAVIFVTWQDLTPETGVQLLLEWRGPGTGMICIQADAWIQLHTRSLTWPVREPS